MLFRSEADVPPEILAESLGQYFRASWLRVRSGNSGVLPVILAIVVVAVVFELITPEHAFLRPSNLVYIFGLSTVYMVLAMAETVVLLLAEVDLSVGAVALIGGVIAFKLVLLDEPTAALGVVQTRQVLDLIKRLRDRGLAVMVISHNLNDVFEVADRIAVLYLGRMVAEGPTADFDRQSVVEYMTTGTSSGRPYEPAGSASGEG